MHKGSISLMLGLNLKKYCENNEIVFNPMFTSSGRKTFAKMVL